MPQLKAKDVRTLSDEELESRISEYRKEYVRLLTLSKRGTLNKESGKVKSFRRLLARLETIRTERRAKPS
jgi:ribosomal protein L29